MIRTASPCCQSAGAKNRPQINPTPRSPSAPALSHGSTAPDSRRKRPGLAKRCRLLPPFRSGTGRGGGVRVVLASTRATIAPESHGLKPGRVAAYQGRPVGWPAVSEEGAAPCCSPSCARTIPRASTCACQTVPRIWTISGPGSRGSSRSGRCWMTRAGRAAVCWSLTLRIVPKPRLSLPATRTPRPGCSPAPSFAPIVGYSVAVSWLLDGLLAGEVGAGLLRLGAAGRPWRRAMDRRAQSHGEEQSESDEEGRQGLLLS